MITKEQKDKWVTALRSGEYKQTKGRLYSGKGYCCLGVYCSAVEGLKLKRAPVDDACENREHYERIKDIIGYGHKEELVNMNDEGKPFSAIADYIQENISCAN